MSPALARIKRGVRAAIGLCGGVDGAAATAERCRSVAGDWNNLNHAALPPLDCALALDEVAIAQGHRPAILAGYAAELGHVIIRLPDVGHGDGALINGMVEASAEFGDVAGAVRDGCRDGQLSQAERAAIIVQIDEAMTALATLRVIASGEDAA